MTNEDRKRIANAVKIALKFQSLIEKGWLLMDENNDRVEKMTIVKDSFGCTRVLQQTSAHSYVIHMIGDPHFENGLELTVAKYNAQYANWKFIPPSSILSFKSAMETV